jgi:hypothetical protein
MGFRPSPYSLRRLLSRRVSRGDATSRILVLGSGMPQPTKRLVRIRENLRLLF